MPSWYRPTAPHSLGLPTVIYYILPICACKIPYWEATQSARVWAIVVPAHALVLKISWGNSYSYAPTHANSISHRTSNHHRHVATEKAISEFDKRSAPDRNLRHTTMSISSIRAFGIPDTGNARIFTILPYSLCWRLLQSIQWPKIFTTIRRHQSGAISVSVSINISDYAL